MGPPFSGTVKHRRECPAHIGLVCHCSAFDLEDAIDSTAQLAKRWVNVIRDDSGTEQSELKAIIDESAHLAKCWANVLRRGAISPPAKDGTLAQVLKRIRMELS